MAEYGASPYRVLNYFGASQDRPVPRGCGKCHRDQRQYRRCHKNSAKWQSGMKTNQTSMSSMCSRVSDENLLTFVHKRSNLPHRHAPMLWPNVYPNTIPWIVTWRKPSIISCRVLIPTVFGKHVQTKHARRIRNILKHVETVAKSSECIVSCKAASQSAEALDAPTFGLQSPGESLQILHIASLRHSGIAA